MRRSSGFASKFKVHYYAGVGELGEMQAELPVSKIGCKSVVNDRDKQGKTPLHHAAAGGHMHVVQFLLGAGCDSNARDSSGRAASFYAQQNDHDAVFALLIENKGSDIEEVAVTSGNLDDFC